MELTGALPVATQPGSNHGSTTAAQSRRDLFGKASKERLLLLSGLELLL
jgi:hypothetical protein